MYIYSFVFYVHIISREAYFHNDIKSDDGYFLTNRSGCGGWYHKKCMNIQVKVFWDKKDRMQWKCSVCRKYIIRIRPDFKICWFVVTRVFFFEYTRPVRNFFLSFWDGKDSIILYFFQEWTSKKILTRTFVVDPVRWQRTNMTALYNLYNESKGFICGGLTWRNTTFSKTWLRKYFFSPVTKVYVRETTMILCIFGFTKFSHFIA